MSLADLNARGFITDDWERWQQGDCGTYAVALLREYPHLRLGGIDFWNFTGPDGEQYDNPGHYVAHDDHYAYDSSGIHPLPYTGVDADGSGRWLPDIGDPEHWGLSENYGECGDYDDGSLADAIRHATTHNILPPQESSCSTS